MWIKHSCCCNIIYYQIRCPFESHKHIFDSNDAYIHCFSLGCAIWIFERVNNEKIFILRTKTKKKHNFSTECSPPKGNKIWTNCVNIMNRKSTKIYGFAEIFTFGQQYKCMYLYMRYAICLQLILIIALYLLQHAFAFSNRNDFAAMVMAMNFKHQIFAFTSIQLTQIHFPYIYALCSMSWQISLFFFSISILVFAHCFCSSLHKSFTMFTRSGNQITCSNRKVWIHSLKYMKNENEIYMNGLAQWSFFFHFSFFCKQELEKFVCVI